MIYTSYFANIKNLPNNIIPIAICGKSPDYYEGLQYKILAPKYSFFIKWKETQDNDYYIEHFYKEVLDKLNPNDVVTQLYTLSNGYDICLICYETPEKFCHRHLVADWLNRSGFECKEFI